MSPPIFPFDAWLQGMEQASIVFNADMLRTQVLLSHALSESVTGQPGGPVDGDVYIIPSGATGSAWSNFDENDMAIFRDGAWYAFAPVIGVRLNVNGTEKVFSGSSGWVNFGTGGGGGGSWGAITGTLSDQVDLQNALNEKAEAFTDLSDAPSSYNFRYMSPIRVNINADGLSFGSTQIESNVISSLTDETTGSFLSFEDSESETDRIYPYSSYMLTGKILVNSVNADSSGSYISDGPMCAIVDAAIAIGWDYVNEEPIINVSSFTVVHSDPALSSVSFSAAVGAQQTGPFGVFWPILIEIEPLSGHQLIARGKLRQN